MTMVTVQCFDGPHDGQRIVFVDCKPLPEYHFAIPVELSYPLMVVNPPPLGRPGKRAIYKLRVRNGIFRYEYMETR